MRNEVLNWFSEALTRVGESYFSLETMYSQEGIIRERVFCYELYHQLRLIQATQPILQSLCLHGEIDKSGHPIFRNFEKNPDFVFHRPGSMESNVCVVEVKGKLVTGDVNKDLTTLLTFVGRYEYQFGLFVCFGHEVEELRPICIQWPESQEFRHLAGQIDILVIERLGSTPYRTTLSNLVQEPAHASK